MANRFSPIRLRLYVAGNAPNSIAARRNLDAMLASCPPETIDLEVVDCLKEPGRTLSDGIIVTPTLKKLEPAPEATVIGTLADSVHLRAAIGLE